MQHPEHAQSLGLERFPRRSRSGARLWSAGLLGVVAVAALLPSGCARVPRARTLDEHIRSVYIPMVKNDSYEPGVEEILTRALQERFLQDGRLLVEADRDADMALECVITQFRNRPIKFEDDEFPWITRAILEATVTAYDPYDYDRAFPLGTWERIPVEYEYAGDPRRVLRHTDVDMKRRALERLADRIVTAVIYEPPDDLEKIEERRSEERATARFRARQIRFRSAYGP